MLMRALVTGGLGFLGRWLVTALDQAGHEVTILDCGPGQHMRAPTLAVDLLTDNLSQALEGMDMVFHLAANASVRGGTDNPALDLEQNLMATSRLLEAMRKAGVPRLMFASSSAVYGNPSVTPTPETAATTEQTSLYGASKLAAEALISAYCHGFGLQATVFRFAPMLGEGYRRGHVWDFYRKLHRNPEHIEVLGDGKQRKAYLYVQDATAAVLTVVDPSDRPARSSPGKFEVYNVGGNTLASVDESLGWICEELGLHPEVTHTGKSWAGDKPMTWLDASRLRALGWTPMVSIRDAVLRTVRSFDD